MRKQSAARHQIRGVYKATTLNPTIDDWTINSLGGSYREFGGSLASNSAALQDSITSTVISNNEGQGGATLAASVGYGSSRMASKALTMNRLDPDLLEHLVEINDKRMNTNAINSTVTLEELGEFPVEPRQEKTEKDKDQR